METQIEAPERMTAAEFRTVREWLAVTGDWLAGHLGVNPRTIRSWEQGRDPIPDGVRLDLEALEDRAAEQVDAAIAALGDADDPVLLVYRDDAEALAAHPDAAWPASWYRRIAARAAHGMPGVAIVYADDLDAEG